MSVVGKVIVLAAFKKNRRGQLVPAFEPRQIDTADRAIRKAKQLAEEHAGVMVYTSQSNPDLGDYGEPNIIFQAGELPDFE